MSVEVKTTFLDTENYLIKAEVTINVAQWKLLFQSIQTSWSEPMASFVGPLKKAVESLEYLVLEKSKL